MGDRKIITLEFPLQHINPVYKGDQKPMLTETSERGEVRSCPRNAVKSPWATSFLYTEVQVGEKMAFLWAAPTSFDFLLCYCFGFMKTIPFLDR